VTRLVPCSPELSKRPARGGHDAGCGSGIPVQRPTGTTRQANAAGSKERWIRKSDPKSRRFSDESV